MAHQNVPKTKWKLTDFTSEFFSLYKYRIISHFDVSIDPFYSESNMKALSKSIKELEQGKVVVKSMA